MNIKALFTKPNIFGTPASAMYAPPPLTIPRNTA